MRFPRLGKGMGVGTLAVVSMGAALVLTSCTCKIKEEQMATITQLRTEERQLNADIEKATRDKARITGELSSRESEVRQCNEKKAFVQDKLNKWPSVWPDYDPNAPAPAPTPAATPKKR
jgi:septal ring factor EnvC (AmiA/AmiB activator)